MTEQKSRANEYSKKCIKHEQTHLLTQVPRIIQKSKQFLILLFFSFICATDRTIVVSLRHELLDDIVQLKCGGNIYDARGSIPFSFY